MQIRKLFKFELAHIVRNAYTQRCAQNIHGHSYKVELFIKSNKVEDAQMLIDFGLVKKGVHDFIDSFDHTFMLWNLPEDEHIVKFACKNFERVIITPFSSSAEMQAKMFYEVCEEILSEIQGFENCKLEKVIVHETDTGYAEYQPHEYDDTPNTYYPIKIFTKDNFAQVLKDPEAIRISEGIAKEWRNQDWVEDYNNTFTM